MPWKYIGIVDIPPKSTLLFIVYIRFWNEHFFYARALRIQPSTELESLVGSACYVTLVPFF